jgi:hypothetical protein
MSFFKKISKGVSSAFKKAPTVVSNIFKKTSDIARNVGSGLGKVGDVLGKVADVGGQILSNPLVDMAGSAVFGPEFGIASNLVGRGLQGVGQASQIARQGSDISNQFSRGSQQLSQGNMGGVADIRGSIQRARDVAGTVGPTFA